MTASKRVAIVGGAGGVGAQAAVALHENGHDVTVVDVRPNSHVAHLPFEEVDIRDTDRLVESLRGGDIAFNAVGPYDQWGTTVLDAAVTAGVAYIDVCDDPKASVAMLDRHSDALAAGLSAVVGMGATPGLSNLLATVAVRRLSRCDLVVVFWGRVHEHLEPEEAETFARSWATFFRGGRAAIEHFFHQISGRVPVWHNGQVCEVTPWQQVYHLRLPKGGAGTYRLVGHPEPLTLPRTLEVGSAYCIGTCGRTIDERLAVVAAGIDRGEVTVGAAGHTVADLLEQNTVGLASEGQVQDIDSFVGVVAQGDLDGHATTVGVLPSGPTLGSLSFETARPAVVAVDHMARVPAGVHAPEAAFDAEDLLADFSARYWPEATSPYRLETVEGHLLDFSSLHDRESGD